MRMRRMDLTASCNAIVDGYIMVPVDMSLDEARNYANAHTEEINFGPIYRNSSSGLKLESCNFHNDNDGLKTTKVCN